MAALGLALISCYGALAITGLLTLAGVRMTLSPDLWAMAIAVTTLLAGSLVAAGFFQHRYPVPALLAVAGVITVQYALFIEYHILTEMLGFALLGAGAVLDLLRRRTSEARTLGL